MKSCLDVEVSCFANCNTATNPQPVNLLKWLISAKYVDKQAIIRAEPDSNRRRQLKATLLPAITPSGTFTYRSEKHLMQHDGLMQFDIDKKENPSIANYADLKEQICKIVHVAYCGLSASGNGYWGLMPIAYPERHKEHFEYMEREFSKVGIKLDNKPKNVASLRVYAYDADAYFNHHATPLQAYYQPPQQPLKRKVYNSSSSDVQADVEALINQLISKGIDITALNHSYNDWINLGFAFVHQFGKGGRQYFHDVSRMHLKYNFQDTENQFNKCLHSISSGTHRTIATFFHLCKQAGVTLERSTKNVIQVKQREIKQSEPIQSAPATPIDETSITALPETSLEQDFSKISMQAINPAPATRPALLQRIPLENWTKEIGSLQAFFDDATLPGWPIKLDASTTITNVGAFMRSHIATISTNNGKPAYRPYLQRLQLLKQHLQTL